jgi:RNA-splicing ligase RtcB
MDLKIFTDNIEDKAREQIDALLSVPVFKDCKVRIMPDVHAGAGCVIGFTANLGDYVIPNVVGVDIGCGMLTVPLGKIGIDYDKLDEVIRENIPSGMNVHSDRFGGHRFDYTLLHCYDCLKNLDRIERSICTLGGGNHFIEIDQDEEGGKCLIIHTGSRNLGKQVAEYWQHIAVSSCIKENEYKERREELIKRLKDSGREREIGKALKLLKESYTSVGNLGIPAELCYLEGKSRERYLNDMRFCQLWAHWNRYEIAMEICVRMGWTYVFHARDWGFETVHNYIDEDNIIRKGAISAKAGERVLIPMNMRDGCIIGVGKGNEDWNCSAPHGAGRIMSRAQAKQEVSLEEYKRSMEGIYTTSVGMDTVDESPMAYKPAREIIKLIEPTVTVSHIMKPVYNFKAGEE